ncbi:Golgin subfamily member [Salix suchowensis]|nr:Golgin subfamily member [Salix suchowensis]
MINLHRATMRLNLHFNHNRFPHPLGLHLSLGPCVEDLFKLVVSSYEQMRTLMYLYHFVLGRNRQLAPCERSFPSTPNPARPALALDPLSTFSRTNSFISTHHTGTVDDTAILGQGYVHRGDPRVIAPSRGGSRSWVCESHYSWWFPSDFVKWFVPWQRCLCYGSARGSSTPHGSSTDLSDEAFFSAGSGTRDTRLRRCTPLTSTGRDRTTTGFTSTGFTATNTTTGLTSGLTSGNSDTNVVSCTMSYRRTDSASYLGDSHDSDSSGSTRTPLTRSSALSRRTGRSNSRSNSSGFPYSSDEASDKENSSNTMSSSSYTQSGTRSSDDTGYDVCHSSDMSALTLNSYLTYSYSTASSSGLSEVPPSSAPSSDIFASASEGSGSYVTAASPASTAFESLPNIPSESEYGTADEAASTDYATASEPSEYITAELCPSEPGTEYLTAIEPREIPSELRPRRLCI